MECSGAETLPRRIQGMLRLEGLFNQKGYLVCQSSGKKIYNFEEVVAVFIPLSSTNDQVMAVHCDCAQSFIQSSIASLHL
ncbi:hypothetical protein REC12_15280 [Desulfosporosinus sp. PR]|uniref:hypothetical protein n=1 Tax=Candidatus Desulfosporosinus nitrosoreducens TaxID=3401928 RepID=UPI0027EB3D4C|nr:hypothetical protein [Desulfosporosinus sp. PR]MDQ7094958.1 hypothetical protein [Desulfosporosinus sp. PR]